MYRKLARDVKKLSKMKYIHCIYYKDNEKCFKTYKNGEIDVKVGIENFGIALFEIDFKKQVPITNIDEIKFSKELLSYNNHNLLIPNENDNGKRIKDCVSNFKKHIINDLKDKYMFKIDNRLLYKVDDIILNENNFILFSREETKTSTLYNTLKSISKSDLIIRYNLGTKNLKKDYINDLIEKSIEKEIITYVKELRRDILYLINKSTMEITQGNLDFLLDDYSNSLNIPFYKYVLKYIYNK